MILYLYDGDDEKLLAEHDLGNLSIPEFNLVNSVLEKLDDAGYFCDGKYAILADGYAYQTDEEGDRELTFF